MVRRAIIDLAMTGRAIKKTKEEESFFWTELLKNKNGSENVIYLT